MLKRILLAPDATAGGGGTPAPAKPAATAPAAKPASVPVAAPKPAVAAPAAAAPAPEPSDDPFAPPPKAAAAAPKAGDKPAAAPAAPDDVDKLAPKELRERYKATKAERDTLTKAKTDLEAKIKQFEAQGKDTTALTGRLTAIEQERDAALAELRAAKQEASPEFKEKYDKPFNMAAERARKQVAELSIVQKVDETTGNVIQEARPATWEDFSALYSLPVGKAIEQANNLFGTSAQFVLGLREKLLDLDSARQTALQEEREQFKQRTEKEIAGRTVEQEKIEKTWTETNTRLAESVADYKNDPEDTELNDARKHALSVFDSKINAADRQDYIQKKVLRDAHIRQRIGAFPVLKLQLSRAQEKITALEAQVEELKGTAPGNVKRPGGTEVPGGEEDWGVGLAKAVQPE
jgi:hypothetical protein